MVGETGLFHPFGGRRFAPASLPAVESNLLRRFSSAPRHKKTARRRHFYGRGDRIRTCDLLLPKQPRYQTALLPVVKKPDNINHAERKGNIKDAPACAPISYQVGFAE